MVKAPYRIALLETDARLAPEHAKLERVVELIAWVHLFQRTVRHPALSVIDPDDAHVTPLDGQFVPMHVLRAGETPAASFFADERRDEVVWLELPLGGARAPLVLRTHRADGSEQSFEAIGGPLSEQIERALGTWLSARGLAPLAPVSTDAACGAPFTAAELIAVAAQLDPMLRQSAREQGGFWTTDPEAEQAELPDGVAPYEAAAMNDTADTTELPTLVESLPPALRIAALRAYSVCTDAPVHAQVLALDADDPWALRDAFFETLKDGRDFTLLRRCIAVAPGWGKPYLSLFVPESLEGEELPGAPSDLETLAAFGVASVCMPQNEYATEGYAERLSDDARDAEALRFAERNLAEAPEYPSSWLPVLDQLEEVERIGAWVRFSGIAANRVGLVVDGQIQPWSADSLRVDLEASNALMNAGRLDEAIALRANRLEGLEGSWPNESQLLARWRKEPRFVAWCYAREGYFRGEDARVLEGFSRAEPDDAVDLAMFMESLVACGRVGDALLAWAHYGRGLGYQSPLSRVSAARALLAAGRFEDALAERLRVLVEAPAHELGAMNDRLGRLLALAPLAPLEAKIQGERARGATTLARLWAREIADFVPSAASSKPVAAALGHGAQLAFEASWLAGFGAGELPSRAAIDTLFSEADAAAASEPLSAADRLVERWREVVFTGSSEPPALARATLYLFAQALARYLCCTTQAPSVLAGALRTVASEGLLWLRDHRDELALDDVRALLAALDPALAKGDGWIADAWLLRVESSLRLEERVSGRLGSLIQGRHGLPCIDALLRGPERIAMETFEAARLLREKPAGFAEPAGALLERLTHLGGGIGAPEWSALATERLEADPALDVVLTCAWLTEGFNAGASVDAAKLLFARGDGEGALEALCTGFGSAGEDWRDEQLELFKPLWKRAKLDVPFPFKKAASSMFEALQRGKPDQAERIGRWLVAIDEENEEAHRNLGLAYASQGKVEQALAHLVKATPDQATQILAGVLTQAGHPAPAMAVLEYASRWYVRAEQWLTFGGVAYTAMDNPRTVHAYRIAYALDPDAFDASQLNAYAGVLDEVGEWAECERISKHLLKLANDAVFTSCGHNQLACAYVGLGRFDEALEHAKKAVKLNPMPENKDGFAQTLAKAKAKVRPTPPPAPDAAGVPREPALELLERGEIKALESRAGAPSWPAQRAVLRANRFRYGSENDVAVTRRAQDTALRLVNATCGATEPEALLTRAMALDVREQAYFAADAPPRLGDRLTRAAFYAEYRARGGVIVGEAPSEARPFVDREVLPGTKLPRASDYVRLLRELARERPKAAIAKLGLDAASYRDVSAQWAAAMGKDASLVETVEAGLVAGG